ncbi:MAG: hypothetical protein DRJ42_15635 [Deltaproteobacteria bacterium]|nr:MAG: hypothetical protein DRJ42_15635 [Deltaproteobacteria bacterium]
MPLAIDSSGRRRSRPLRLEQDEHLWFITTRTIEERFWLHPLLTTGLEPPNRKARRACDRFKRRCAKRWVRLARRANARKKPMAPELTPEEVKRMAQNLLGAALARAQEHCEVEIFAIVCMSNHIHLVIRTKKRNLSKFVGYFKARVATAINQLTGKRGPLWARRYDAQPILNDEAAMERVVYTIDNPGKANLVEDPGGWPGFSAAYGLGEADELTFEYFDRTAWHKAKRPRDRGPFWRTATLVLSPLPNCVDVVRERVGESLRAQLKNSSEARAAGGKRAVGIERVLAAGFETRPQKASFGRRPYCFGSAREKREYSEGMGRVCRLHAEAAERFRNGDRTAVFPAGTYPPALPLAA